MTKELKVGTNYYVKVVIPSYDEPQTSSDSGITISTTTKYRVNGGAWQTRTGTFYFEYSGISNQFKYFDGSWHVLSANDVFEFVGVFSYIVTLPEFAFLIELVRNGAISNPYEMNIYQMKCEQHKVEKTTTGTNPDLVLLDTLYGTLREDTDLLQPSILIQSSSLPQFNYVEIPSFNRFYFVTGVQCVRNDIYRIDLKVDVLKTYATDIKSQNAYISRNENTTISTLADNRMPISNQIQLSTTDVTGGTLSNITFGSNAEHNVVLSVINNLSLTAISGLAIKPSPTSSGLPSITANYGDNPLEYNYVIDYGRWFFISDAIKTTSSLASYVVSCIAFPFDVRNIDAKTSGGTYELENVVIENTPMVLPDSTNIKGNILFGSLSSYLVIADFTITKIFSGTTQNFLNYSPYMEIDLFIPFVGWQNLNTEDVMGDRILVFYAVDYGTGNGVAYVYNYSKQKIVNSYNCTIGVKLAVTTTNNEEITRQKQANTNNLLLGLLGGAVSGAVGIGSGNPLGVVGGVLSSVHAIADYVNKDMMMIPKGNTSIGGERYGVYSQMKVYLRKKYHNALITYNDSIYAHTQGHPTNTYSVLTSISGYTEIPEMHYVPSTQLYITQSEIDEIVLLARDGIIL